MSGTATYIAPSEDAGFGGRGRVYRLDPPYQGVMGRVSVVLRGQPPTEAVMFPASEDLGTDFEHEAWASVQFPVTPASVHEDLLTLIGYEVVR